jgi:hypothetical protein
MIKVFDEKDIVDEVCKCRHLRSEHNDRFDRGHGPCQLCSCEQFTWKEFVYKVEVK